jgi:hypothetical protein
VTPREEERRSRRPTARDRVTMLIQSGERAMSTDAAESLYGISATGFRRSHARERGAQTGTGIRRYRSHVSDIRLDLRITYHRFDK